MVDCDNIRRILRPRGAAKFTWFDAARRAVSVTIALVGPLAQFDKLCEILMNRFSSVPVEVTNISDEIEEVIPNRVVAVSLFAARRPRRNRTVGLFEYDNNTDIDLSWIQVFRRRDAPWDEHEELCFIYTLRLCGVEEYLLDHIKCNMPGYAMPKQCLHRISELLDRPIHVYETRDPKLRANRTNAVRKRVYGGGTGSSVHMGLFICHGFPLLPTRYTKFSIEHYEEVRHLPYWWNITRRLRGTGWARELSRRKLNTLELLTLMWRRGMFDEGTRYTYHPRNTMVVEVDPRLINLEQRKWKIRRLYNKNCYIVAADLECDVVSGEVHVPLIAGYSDMAMNVRQWIGERCVSSMFDCIA